MSSGSVSRSASRIAGATRPPSRSAMATPRCTPDTGRERVVRPEAVQGGELARGDGHRLVEEGCGQHALLHRDAFVVAREPRERVRERDVVLEVVVRDLALRARHEVADREPHRRRLVDGRARLRLRCFGRDAARRRAFDLGRRDRVPGLRRHQRVEVDAQLDGAPPRGTARRRPGRWVAQVAVARARARARAEQLVAVLRAPAVAVAVAGAQPVPSAPPEAARPELRWASRRGPARPRPRAAPDERRERCADLDLGALGYSSSPITPSSKISTSMSALSVLTTATRSPRCTVSPGCTSHSSTVPESMSAPSDGMRKIPLGLSHRRSVRVAAATTASTLGSAASSSCLAYGIGTSAPHTRSTGASRS